MRSSWQHVSVQPLTPTFGALVAGIDPTEVSTSAADELRTVFRQYKLIFIHAAAGLSANSLVKFSRIFGEPNVYPRAGFEPKEGENPHALRVLQREDSSTVPFGAAGWHTDTSYIRTPPVRGLVKTCLSVFSCAAPHLLSTVGACSLPRCFMQCKLLDRGSGTLFLVMLLLHLAVSARGCSGSCARSGPCTPLHCVALTTGSMTMDRTPSPPTVCWLPHIPLCARTRKLARRRSMLMQSTVEVLKDGQRQSQHLCLTTCALW